MSQAAIFQPETYTKPEAEFETKPTTVKSQEIRKGDTFRGLEVTGVKVGRKWVYVSAEGRKAAIELEMDVVYEIERKSQTRESIDAQFRARKNQKLAQRLADRSHGANAAAEKVSRAIAEHGFADYSAITNLLSEQAETRLLHHFYGFATNREYADLVEAQEAFIEVLKEQLLSDFRHRALSRSTSVVANLMEDVDKEAAAKFLENHRWYF